ncbi:sugar ABC transporter substrate-binding protein [Amycolatopsis marina]|uniref:sugar ABC transporter substrate-binding protein n=1 Tax=Amycolatopsis marina TaxID=490629 RepID=UPI0015A5C8BA|nr:extracellular solute-binding protein [Amycolatopsis marina]
MRSLDFAAGLPFFSDVSLAASTIVAICAAITAVTALIGAVRSNRRKDRARRLKIGWQVGSEAERTGALMFNESKLAFEEVVLTVTCGLHGREARQDVGVLPSGQDYLWASGSVHESISSRPVGRPVEQAAGTSHDSRPHGVQVTFRNGRGFWFRDEAQVKRVRSLVIWAEKTRAVTLSQYFGRRSYFRRAYPVSVNVQPFERTEDLEAAFTKLAATGDAPRGHDIPDVVVGPHDWIGRVALEESVVEPPISAQRLRQISPVALDALSRDGRLYGIPYVFDTVAMIRNNALTGPGPMPATFAGAVAAGRDALRSNGIEDGVALALQVGAPDANGNAGDPYHLWPLFSSLGGSFFGYREPGHYGEDKFDDISLWRPSFVDAFVRLAELGRDGTLSPKLGRAEAVSLFLEGRAPFFVCSSRALSAIRARNLDVTVGPVPAAGELPARPLVSTYGFFIYQGAQSLPAARDLVSSYLSQPRAGLDLNRIQPLVPVQEEAMSTIAERDAVLSPYVDQCRDGLIMPSRPEMREAWQLLGRTEYQVLAGDGDPRALAEAAATAGWELLGTTRGVG